MNEQDLFHKFMEFTTNVHRVTHELTENIKSDDITQVQYGILEYIAVNHTVTPSQISDCKYLSMPNTSRELRKLSEKNLIEKFGDNEDRRKQYVRLSKDGEIMMNKAFVCVESRLMNRIQNASKEDLEEIDRALEILQTKLFY